MTDLPSILPCPFCGSSDIRLISGFANASRYVKCEACSSRGPTESREHQAISIWNIVSQGLP